MPDDAKSRPDYDIAFVDDVPEDAPTRGRGPGRSQVYNNLEALIENPGQWAQVAQYNTSTQAKAVADSYIEGKRDLPGSDDVDFELLHRKVELEDGRRGSALFARVVGDE